MVVPSSEGLHDVEIAPVMTARQNHSERTVQCYEQLVSFLKPAERPPPDSCCQKQTIWHAKRAAWHSSGHESEALSAACAVDGFFGRM